MLKGPGFVFGGNTPWSYEELQKRRDVARRMIEANSRTPKTVGEGLHAVGRALAARNLNKRAGRREGELQGEADKLWADAFGMGSPVSGGSQPYASSGAAPSVPAPISESQGIANAAMAAIGKEPLKPDMAGLISETAAELGMDPLDLATIISYETAGTFDPTKRGPTTQWGQHKGLIQFGEPQAKQYGVNWDDPINSQLGRDGAIVRYFRENGWQPGMGMLDAYSIVNAGAPGRYNASDANNGGAPGSVADKVNNQMAGHRRKAQSLLGGNYTPSAPSGGGQSGGQPSVGRHVNMQAIMAAMSNPMIRRDPGKMAVLNAMMQQAMTPPAPPAPQYSQKSGADLGLTGDDANAIFNVSPDGKISRIGGGGVTVNNTIPAQAKPLGTKGQLLVPDETAEGGYRVVNAEGSEAARAAQEAATVTEQVEKREATQAANAITSADTVLDTISEIRGITKPKETLFGRVTDLPETGIVGEQLARRGLNQEAVDVKNKLATLESKIAFDRLQRMREASKTGGALGAVSERELTLLSSDMGALAQSSSAEEFDKVLSRIEQNYTQIMQKFAADPAMLAEYPELQQFAQSAETSSGAGQPVTPVTDMSKEQFLASPSAIAAAEAAGVTVEDMWRILEGQR